MKPRLVTNECIESQTKWNLSAYMALWGKVTPQHLQCSVGGRKTEAHVHFFSFFAFIVQYSSIVHVLSRQVYEKQAFKASSVGFVSVILCLNTQFLVCDECGQQWAGCSRQREWRLWNWITFLSHPILIYFFMPHPIFVTSIVMNLAKS